MLDFCTRFFICNLFIAGMTGGILLLKQVLKKHLSSRMQYNLWFIVFALLSTPFLPIRLTELTPVLSWFPMSALDLTSNTGAVSQAASISGSGNAFDWINDFSMSVTRNASSSLNIALLCIWLAGIFGMILFMVKSRLHLYQLEAASLPLQNQDIQGIFAECKAELKLHKDIPVYSSAYIKSPFTVGIITPRIYLPIHLISDYDQTDCRFILLHELQHCKHKDAIVNGLMNLVNVVYWFNPMIWYFLKEMRSDREMARDAAVLDLLQEQEYEKYGNALINFAEKISLSAFPFTSGIGGSMKQIKRRIMQIASYKKKTALEKCKSILLYCLIAALMLSFAPLLSVQAANHDSYHPQTDKQHRSAIDLSDYFEGYAGSFVLYDSAHDSWQIYNESGAKRRVSPNSTYKIYSALYALEHDLITPKANALTWNGQTYPIEEWNANQDLSSAFRYSVNWYFQTLDERAGLPALKEFYADIGYGNHDLSGDISDFWMESSLQISPLEQVELLQKMYTNQFDFEEENIQTVKDALLLSSNKNGSLYGKTGTGAVNGKNINGWFIGYVETTDNTWFFAANIASENRTAIGTLSDADSASTENQNANGATASEITLQILQDKNIY